MRRRWTEFGDHPRAGRGRTGRGPLRPSCHRLPAVGRNAGTDRRFEHLLALRSRCGFPSMNRCWPSGWCRTRRSAIAVRVLKSLAWAASAQGAGDEHSALLQPVPGPRAGGADAHAADGRAALIGRNRRVAGSATATKTQPQLNFPARFATRRDHRHFCPRLVPAGADRAFGEKIESIRPFEVETQRSRERLKAIDVTAVTGVGEGSGSEKRKGAKHLPLPTGRTSHLAEYLPPQSWFLLVEPGELESEGRQYLERLANPQGYHGGPT